MAETDIYSTIEPKVYDVTIIGGGPAGLFGAFYAGMRKMSAKIIDSLPELGGQLAALYPEKFIYDMPGFPKILAKELVANLVEQASRYDTAICLSQKVLNLNKGEDGVITLRTDKGTHRSKTVILAAGAGAFSPIKLDVPGVADFDDRGVYYAVRDKLLFAGKRLLVIGGGDSAVDWCMNLEQFASKIHLIHRRDVFKAHEESVDWLLRRSPVEVRLFHELRRVEGDEAVQRAVIFSNKTADEIILEVDAVLLNLGFRADIGPVKEWGITLEGNKVAVDRFMQTNIPGIYAAGDIASYPGKLDLIATGVGEICTAVYHAKTCVDPEARFKQVHSSGLAM